MTDITILSEKVSENIISYIKTAYNSNDDTFNQERNKFLIDNSPIFKEPYYELIKRYKLSNVSLSDYLKNEVIGQNNFPEDVKNAFSSFFKVLGIEYLFTHQIESLQNCLLDDKNIVVTTGTGSGKTLCFLLPLIANILLEALGTKGRSNWSANNECFYIPWWKNPNGAFSPTRRQTNRTAAVRCLLVYPLNALVQDQIESLRDILNSESAENFYDNYLQGDRIFLGQYNGLTEGKGSLSNPRNFEKARRYLKAIDKEYSAADSEHEKRVQKNHGSELLLRWDMQRTPPDILITNFTMLSIMLVRELEKPIFDKTKQWLEESDQNIFYLVLDELHSYRGTAGSEISYTIKTFIERIGLHPNHKQLRIISTSASLEGNGEIDNNVDPEFLRDFFGTASNKKYFNVIEGDFIDYKKIEPTKLQDLSNDFKNFEASLKDDVELQKLSESVSKSDIDFQGDKNAPDLFENSLFTLEGKLLKNYSGNADLVQYPLTISDIANEFFFGNSDAAKGFLSFISLNENTKTEFKGKLRQHLFIKNLQGIRRAMSIEKNTLVPPILYESSVSHCPKTSSITLDVLYCQVCGELYYRGYKNSSIKGASYVTNQVLNPKEEQSYIYINFAEEPSSQDNVYKGWNTSYYFNGTTGEIVGQVKFNDKEAKQFFARINFHECLESKIPTTCPACETTWAQRGDKITSPIRTMGTGYQKLNQVIIEPLMSCLSGSNDSQKTVIFSDSRRDAALVAADLEYNHFRDAVRATVEDILEVGQESQELLKDYILGCKNGETKRTIKHPFRKISPENAALIEHFYLGAFTPKDDEFHSAKSIISLGGKDYFSISWIYDECFNRLIDSGINPTGVRFDNSDEELWPVLLAPQHKKLESGNEIKINEYKDALNFEIRKVITDSMGRDFESLGFGWLTYDRDKLSNSKNSQSEYYIGFIDSIIRFLSFYYKTRNGELFASSGCQYLPQYFTDWLHTTFPNFINYQDRKSVSDETKEFLNRHHIIDDLFRIKFSRLFIHKPQTLYWECNKCRSIHLFNTSDRCRTVKHRNTCDGNLVQCSIKELNQKENYYKNFRLEDRNKMPLRTAEVVGHTDKDDQRKRQLYFQNIFLDGIKSHFMNPEAISKHCGIEALSVTTTMEAGVDIGGLKSVYLANMPPRRFNYQQRVGRAGRRKDKLSIAVTFCKGQKHDEYYFENPHLMISERTSAPKLDVQSNSIIQRVVNKFLLNYVFDKSDQIYIADGLKGDTNSGKLGSLSDFRNNKSAIIDYIKNESNSVVHLKKIFTHLSDDKIWSFVEETINNIEHLYSSRLGELDTHYGVTASFSEVLTLEGYFPLYGMPNRNVSLIHKNPNFEPNNREYPIKKNKIDRSEDIAISEYIPGQEVIKDKKKLHCIGVGWLEKSRGEIVGKPPSSAATEDLYLCTACESLVDGPTDTCPYCDESDSIQTYLGWKPSVYITDFKNKNYDGFVDSSPQSIILTPENSDESGLNSVNVGNCLIKSDRGFIYKLNTNEQKGFSFKRVDEGQFRNLYLSSKSENVVARNVITNSIEELNNVALFSKQFTDFLIIEMIQSPDYLTDYSGSGRTLSSIKSAWRSLAEMLKTCITLKEDIEPTELSSGILWRNNRWKIFISDTLDNGAGYSSKYANSKIFKELLDYAYTQYSINFLLTPGHSKSCITSCYKCLRSYENRLYHNNLDWRLSLDLLSLILGENLSNIQFKDYWKDILQNNIAPLFTSLIGNEVSTLTIDSQTVYIDENGIALLPIHPFIGDTNLIEKMMSSIRSQLKTNKLFHFSPYALLRSPVEEFQWIKRLNKAGN